MLGTSEEALGPPRPQPFPLPKASLSQGVGRGHHQWQEDSPDLHQGGHKGQHWGVHAPSKQGRGSMG